MNKGKYKTILIVLSLIGVLTFLFIKTQEYDEQTHHDVILTIQQLSHQDALLNESILEFRADRFSNYDSITQQNKRINSHLDWFRSEASGLYNEYGEDLDNAIDETERHFSEKMELIERFKSHNGILKNSMYYLPTAVEKSQRTSTSSTFNTDLNHLLREILLFNTWPNDQNKSIASMYINVLENTQKTDLIEISQHAETILYVVLSDAIVSNTTSNHVRPGRLFR